jgi:hypothetical protein
MSGIADLLNGENYRNYALPALGIIEAIATKGKSNSAMGQMNAYDKADDEKYTRDRQAKLDAQTAASDAIRNRLGGLQITNAENEGLDRRTQQAKVEALNGKLGKTPEETSFYNAYPEQYAQQLKPPATQLLLDADGTYHAGLKSTGKDAVTGEDIKAPPKPIPGAASAGKEWNKQNGVLNKEYKQAISSTRSGVNLGSADLAYNGIKKTLDSKEITPTDVLIVKDQLIKLANPGYAINAQQFAHSSLGGVSDRASNLLSQIQGTHSLTPKQIQEYKNIVTRFGSDLRDEHNSIKAYYSSRARDLSQHNNWTDSDSLKVEPMNYSFDAADTPAGGISDQDIIDQAMGKKK